MSVRCIRGLRWRRRSWNRRRLAHASLFECVSQRFGVLPHAAVPRNHRHELGRLAEQFHRRKVHRVERANRFGPAAATPRSARRRRGLRFATIGIDQLRGRTVRQTDVGPVLEWVATLLRRMENARGNERIPPAGRGRARRRSWRHEFGNDTSMRGHRNPLSGLNSPDIAAQVVLQLADYRLHVSSMATCGHIGNGRR